MQTLAVGNKRCPGVHCCAHGATPVLHLIAGEHAGLQTWVQPSARRCLKSAHNGSTAAQPTARGFTLLELMIVVAIIALATAGVSLALRDGSESALDREALRLSALLEAARAQSRTSGLPVVWRHTNQGFEFIGVTPSTATGTDNLSTARSWLSPDTRALIIQPPAASVLVLGPEPLIEAQQVQLMQGDRQLTLSTDGLAPFAVLTQPLTP